MTGRGTLGVTPLASSSFPKRAGIASAVRAAALQLASGYSITKTPTTCRGLRIGRTHEYTTKIHIVYAPTIAPDATLYKNVDEHTYHIKT